MQGFLLFAGPDYYPRGGACDFIGIYRSAEEAKRRAEELAHTGDDGYDIGWAHIAVWDGDRLRIVLQCDELRKDEMPAGERPVWYGPWLDDEGAPAP